MSFASYRELGFDTVLCVEGINDVSASQHFLRLLDLDQNVIVIPLGGSQFVNADRSHELAELKRLADNVAVLIDSEKHHEGEPLVRDREAFRGVCESLGIKCHVTKRRAFEHYMSDRAVKSTFGQSFRALDPYEDRATVSKVWAKNENWRIAQNMSHDEWTATDIGVFLQSLRRPDPR